MSNTEGRGELAKVLVAWRSRLAPAEVGFADAGPRRVTGLRRAEVALLANISVDYLERLEQGRARRPSPGVLESLARALRLDKAERDHLFHAAGAALPLPGEMPRLLSPGALRIVDRLSDFPVAAFDAAWNLITANPAWNLLFGEVRVGSSRPLSANVAWMELTGRLNELILMDQSSRSRFRAALVSDLRAAALRYPSDDHLRSLIAMLERETPAFARLWSSGEVVSHESHKKCVVHPTVGRIELDCDIVHLPDGGVRLVVYSASAGTEEETKLRLAITVANESFVSGQAI